jgi:hypothetical protein
MTCVDCQALIIEIARGAEIDRASRDEARRHAALCATCGAQQQEQEWLTTQFRAIADAEASQNAPERVEIAALAAWRASHAAPTATSAQIAQPATPKARVLAGRWMIASVGVGSLAAAAMAMLFVWPSHHRNTPSAGTLSRTVGTVAAAPRNTEDRDGRETSATGAAVDAGAEAPDTPQIETVLARATGRDVEEFLPLPYVEPLRATEARHVVRVSMTSGDEMILGVLPADRRNGQPFEADVLVGEDGIARAIRVVR